MQKEEGKKWFQISSNTNSGILPRCESQTYSAADGPEGDHPLNAVGVAAAVGFDAGVVSLLQHKLLPAKAGVLIAHPAAKKKKVLVNDITAVARLERIFPVTYAPHSTFRERMFSIPHSMMFWQLAVNSIRLPWKCSWSYTVICKNRWSQSKCGWKHNPNLPLSVLEELSVICLTFQGPIGIGFVWAILLSIFQMNLWENVHTMTGKVEKLQC